MLLIWQVAVEYGYIKKIIFHLLRIILRLIAKNLKLSLIPVEQSLFAITASYESTFGVLQIFDLNMKLLYNSQSGILNQGVHHQTLDF